MKKVLDSSYLGASFIAFSGAIKGKFNDVLKNVAIGGLIYTSLEGVAHEYKTVVPNEGRCARAFRIGNPLAKAVVLFYAAGIDMIKDAVGDGYTQIIMQPAFATFLTILLSRGAMAYYKGGKLDGALMMSVAASIVGGIVGTAIDNEKVSEVSLLTGAGLCFIQAAARAYQAVQPQEDEEIIYTMVN